MRIAAVTSITEHVVIAAEIVAAGKTLEAVAAGDAGMQHYFVSGLHPRNQVAHFAHHSGDVAAEYVRQRNRNSRQASSAPNIEVIERARSHFD